MDAGFPEEKLLVRAEVQRLRSLELVQAARAMGASDARIIVRHLLPNAIAPVLVAATFGVPPPTSSWGELLTQARRYLVHPGAWWLTLFHGLAISVTVTAFHLPGMGCARRWIQRVNSRQSTVDRPDGTRRIGTPSWRPSNSASCW